MKFVDEFRDPVVARNLVDRIRRTVSRPWTIMEVCGGQTHALLRHGIDQALHDSVELLHGPGCPVCVTPVEAIDNAIHIALRQNCILTTFGDMLRVPGSSSSLNAARSQGAQIKMVYSPLDAVSLARQHPERQVVFLAVGFETTAPATALAVLQAESLGLGNFSLLTAHVRVQPAMEFMASATDRRIDAFLAAGHVCTVTGYQSYESMAAQHRLPIVVTGFEPVDLLQGIYRCVCMLEQRDYRAVNAYQRSVQCQGNLDAQRIVEQVFEVADQPWRGMGVMPRAGLRLRPRFHMFDAQHKFDQPRISPAQAEVCPSGEVMTGRLRPTDCPHFGTRCRPEHPLGAPMVSSEGACAAYMTYQLPVDQMADRGAGQ